MLWLVLTHNPTASLIMDVVTLVGLIALGIYLFYIKWRYGTWIDVGRAKIIAALIGRDNIVRLIKARPMGNFLDLGRYGKIVVEPSSMYKVQANTNNLMAFVYSPYAINMPVEAPVLADGGEHELIPVKWQELENKIKTSLNPRRVDELITYKVNEVLADKSRFSLGGGLGTVLMIVVAVAIIMVFLSGVH